MTAGKTEDVSTSSREVARKLRETAIQNMKRMEQLSSLERTSSMEIGWIAFRMKESNQFEMLKLSEEEARQKVRMERSNWYRLIRIASGLRKLKKGDFLKLYAGKANLLLQLPEDERYKPLWLKRAEDPDLSEAELESMIASVVESGEVKQDATVVEEREWLKIRMYKSALDAVMQKLTEFCKKHALGDDFGRAIELIVADKSEDVMTSDEIEMLRRVRAALQDKMPELRVTVELLKDSSRPADERCSAFERAANTFLTALSEAAVMKKTKAKK